MCKMNAINAQKSMDDNYRSTPIYTYDKSVFVIIIICCSWPWVALYKHKLYNWHCDTVSESRGDGMLLIPSLKLFLDVAPPPPLLHALKVTHIPFESGQQVQLL